MLELHNILGESIPKGNVLESKLVEIKDIP